ncbi:MAG: hypothetical protein A2Y77_08735 [Planctomycetes bacterium RBG_13_62_9]|nr:MAG: hypothetical protein A2Y77_08735 [Planctomycetes bacterium RBG_13_62_9]
MMSHRGTSRQHILFCNCAHYAIIPAATKERVLAALTSTDGIQVETVADLCGLAANRDPRMERWAKQSPLTVVACFPRAVRWLFHAAGAPLTDGQTRIFNMRTQSPEEIAQELIIDDGLLMIEEESGRSATNHQSSIINHQSDWVPWFPVIDYSRCRNCKQCLNFCLFGVYRLSDEGRVEVRNPAGCKTNCPACARMCPQKAIIFPKYADAPINGDEITSTTEVNPQSDNIYDRIRQRGAAHKRFSAQSNEVPCPTIESLKRELGVPDSVLASLSREETQNLASLQKKLAAKSRGDAGQSPAEIDRKDGGPDG